MCKLYAIAAPVLLVGLMSCGGGSNITQPSPVTNTLSVNPTTNAVVAGGGTFTAAVASNVSWSAASDSSWLTISSGSTGTNNGAINYAVAANAGTARTGRLNLSGSGVSATLTVSQAAFTPPPPGTLSVTPTFFTIAPHGESKTVQVTAPTSGATWTATSNQTFLTITSGASGTGNGTIAYTVATNPGGRRTAQITVTSGSSTAIHDANQDALALAPTSELLPAGLTSRTANVTATVSWTASSDASWLTITSGASGSGNGTIVYTASANTGATRTGRITLSGGGTTAVLTVTQAEGSGSPAPTLTINPTTNDVGAGAGGSFTAVVTATGAWTAASNTTWLTINSGTTGSGNGSIGYSVSANTGSARSGQITVTGAGGTAVLTVNQAAGTQTVTADFTITKTTATNPGACEVEADTSPRILCVFASTSQPTSLITGYSWSVTIGSSTKILGTGATLSNPTLGCGDVLPTSQTAYPVVFRLTVSTASGPVIREITYSVIKPGGC